MALLPLEAGNPPRDLRVTAEVARREFATDQAWAEACVKTVQRIGRCVPFPKVETYQLNARGDVTILTVEHRPHAS